MVGCHKGLNWKRCSAVVWAVHQAEIHHQYFACDHARKISDSLHRRLRCGPARQVGLTVLQTVTASMRNCYYAVADCWAVAPIQICLSCVLAPPHPVYSNDSERRMYTLARRVSRKGYYWLAWVVRQKYLVVVPLTQNSIDVVLRQTRSEIQTAPGSESAVCTNIRPRPVSGYVAVVTLLLTLKLLMRLTAQKEERHYVNMVALVRDSVYRCRNLTLMRWTCCYQGGVV